MRKVVEHAHLPHRARSAYLRFESGPRWTGGQPSFRRNAVPEQLPDRPDVLGQSSRHHQGSPNCRFRAETSMRRAEVVDHSQEVEARFEGCPSADQVARSPREHGEPLSEGCVEPLDVAGRDHPATDLMPEPDEYKLQTGQKVRSSWAAGPATIATMPRQ